MMEEVAKSWTPDYLKKILNSTCSAQKDLVRKMFAETHQQIIWHLFLLRDIFEWDTQKLDTLPIRDYKSLYEELSIPRRLFNRLVEAEEEKVSSSCSNRCSLKNLLPELNDVGFFQHCINGVLQNANVTLRECIGYLPSHMVPTFYFLVGRNLFYLLPPNSIGVFPAYHYHELSMMDLYLLVKEEEG